MAARVFAKQVNANFESQNDSFESTLGTPQEFQAAQREAMDENKEPSVMEPSSAHQESPAADAGMDAEDDELHSPPSAPEADAAKDTDVAEPKVSVTCNKCGQDKLESECVKKGRKFLCKFCNTAASSLSRALGGMDSTFLDLPREEQQKFWSACHGASKAQMMTLYESKVSAKITQEQSQGTSGGFFPLGYYEKKGFDTQRIVAKSKPEDVQEHAVLGTVYRVHLDFSDSRYRKSIHEERSAVGSADHGVAKDETKVKVPAAKNKAGGKPLTASQKARVEKKLLTSNARLFTTATKVVAALSQQMTQSESLIAAKKDDPAAGWQQATEHWKTMKKHYDNASEVIRKYNQSNKSALDDYELPDMKACKSLASTFTALVKTMRGTEGKKRKASDAN